MHVDSPRRSTDRLPSESRSGWKWRPWRGGDNVALGLAAVVLAMVAFVAFAFESTGQIGTEIEELRTQDLELFDQAWNIRFLDQELTLAASRYIDADTADRAEWRASYDRAAAELDSALARTRATGDPTDLVHLDLVNQANDQLIGLETQIFELSDRGNADEARAVLSGEYAVQKEIYRQGIDDYFVAQQDRIDSQIDLITAETRTARVLVSVVLGVITLVVAFIARINHVQKGQARSRDAERDAFASRQLRQAEVRDGFEMSLTEADALATFEAALRQELHDWRGEILLADSSTAHLHRAATTHPGAAEPACAVATPTDCPAIRRGSTLTFSGEDSYSSCPHLRGRDLDGGTAVCVPLKVMGKSIGIVHACAPAPPVREELDRLHLIVQTGGDRLGVLRAFATTRKQARRDPLTGLLNRRSLEEASAELDRGGRSYSVAFCDLDQFKSLNDTHGHGTGDRALRVFAQALTTALRPGDLFARWGGEEFVIVFPETEATDAVSALERLGEALALALMSGGIPHFTFSAGVSDAAGDFAAATASADAALLEAKRLGRDRVVLAEATTDAGEPGASKAASNRVAE